MIDRRLKLVLLLYLWAALVEDTVLFLVSWFAPDVWFRVFHHSVPVDLDIAFLRRSGGQWAAFALGQALTLWRWRKEPFWLPFAAGLRFSDLFTDICYVLAAPSLTTIGWVLLVPPPLLNLLGIIIFLRGYEQMQSANPPAR